MVELSDQLAMSEERLQAFFTRKPPRFGDECFAAVVGKFGVHRSAITSVGRQRAARILVYRATALAGEGVTY